MSNPKRYGQFPALEAAVREMSLGGVALIRYWHKAMIDGLRAFRTAYPAEARDYWSRSEVGAAVTALDAWLAVMEELAAMLADPKVADWCCKRGMLAHPDPCPQHPTPIPGAVRDLAGADRYQVYVVAPELGLRGWYEVGAECDD